MAAAASCALMTYSKVAHAEEETFIEVEVPFELEEGQVKVIKVGQQIIRVSRYEG